MWNTLVRNLKEWGLALLFLSCAMGLFVTPAGAGRPDFRVESGSLDGAEFKLVRPFGWEGRVLILAHGWRPERGPLVADLDPADPLVQDLLNDGWLVAASSYRRNGLIIDEAVQDLHNLMAHIVKEHGPCRRIVVEGSSLGASIATLMAEAEGRDWSHMRRMFMVSGVIALGADFEAEGPDGPLDWTWRPGVPLLLMSNRSEMASPVDYAFRANTAPQKPVLWRLERDGHVNINRAERLRAIAAVDRWLDTGRRPTGETPYGLDVTVDRSDRPSVAQPTPRGLRGSVLAVDAAYGNIDTDFVVADLDSLGIDRRFRIRCGEITRKVFFGDSYEDVESGKLVAFINADGALRLALNRGRAARRFKCQAGDALEMLPARARRSPRD